MRCPSVYAASIHFSRPTVRETSTIGKPLRMSWPAVRIFQAISSAALVDLSVTFVADIAINHAGRARGPSGKYPFVVGAELSGSASTRRSLANGSGVETDAHAY